MLGKFICLEGIDASGKTSVSDEIIELLNERKIKAIQLYKKQTDYPSKYLTYFMSSFKELLWEAKNDYPVREITDNGWLFLHAAWYTIMAENLILPNLKNYEIVLIDSWYYKILARFLAKQQFDYELVNRVFFHLPKGNHIFMLDASPEICWERRKDFKPAELGENEKFEGSSYSRFISYQNQVREQYLNLSHNKNWHVINTESKTIKQVSHNIVDTLEKLL
ncbi:dTMP kinase [Alkaliphilus peptidifermentans]|uniref:Thymidylate kinase n=1 Tax=Alkaliphilus peptidifermentans DSM 18978 TaxID=1120976 RepID=A0A1G5LA23_9FIRM|nr:dTMP kinase [Alkaliphilus peptidifermentans]SCZ09444.1 Thymidylate kinase [Alkaliphilus peptidifermentans DSM 18978]